MTPIDKLYLCNEKNNSQKNISFFPKASGKYLPTFLTMLALKVNYLGRKSGKVKSAYFATKNSVFLQKVVKILFISYNYNYSKSVNFKSKISLSVLAKLNILPRIDLFIDLHSPISGLENFLANTFPIWEIVCPTFPILV
jgi:hypothetical protein